MTCFATFHLLSVVSGFKASCEMGTTRGWGCGTAAYHEEFGSRRVNGWPRKNPSLSASSTNPQPPLTFNAGPPKNRTFPWGCWVARRVGTIPRAKVRCSFSGRCVRRWQRSVESTVPCYRGSGEIYSRIARAGTKKHGQMRTRLTTTSAWTRTSNDYSSTSAHAPNHGNFTTTLDTRPPHHSRPRGNSSTWKTADSGVWCVRLLSVFSAFWPFSAPSCLPA